MLDSCELEAPAEVVWSCTARVSNGERASECEWARPQKGRAQRLPARWVGCATRLVGWWRGTFVCHQSSCARVSDRRPFLVDEVSPPSTNARARPPDATTHDPPPALEDRRTPTHVRGTDHCRTVSPLSSLYVRWCGALARSGLVLLSAAWALVAERGTRPAHSSDATRAPPHDTRHDRWTNRRDGRKSTRAALRVRSLGALLFSCCFLPLAVGAHTPKQLLLPPQPTGDMTT